eukprot:CAMPEP_0173138682 /NCGR_PEP_ID=MMETSP1105-20130129/3830_1 /TAXON_ID=2985 /ORGANISM="Ochromonas sp., Strain BG-1" /LENGTH=1475 /DNA_ID=CAMNT_0014051313 /DNA_START=946 /DNA_END=5373 /DNA_ORIENTATION=-
MLLIKKELLMIDFIFLTFLVGNDFLPHLPTLDISEHAFDVILQAYRDLYQLSPGYIVEHGEIKDIERFEKLCMIIGSKEQDILANRELSQKEFHKKRRSRKEISPEEHAAMKEEELAADEKFEEAFLEAMQGDDYVPHAGADFDEEDDEIEEEDDYADGDDEENDDEEVAVKGKGKQKDYRSRYYYEKYHFLTIENEGLKQLEAIKTQYLKGLMWCLAYYVKGCISWTWYFPYHYGPMLQDMKGLTELAKQITFDLGQPFTPYQQLLGCLPPASSNLLPKCYQWLMLNDASPMIDFYPLTFKIDQDGKKNPWEAVVLLNFIDEKLLLATEKEVCTVNKLTKAEISRNQFGKIIHYHYDPAIVDSYLTCSKENGLSDIHHCHSRASEQSFSLLPGHYFKPELIEGTTAPIAGFPSLTMIGLNKVTIEAMKLNIFGSDSRYQSIIIHLDTSHYEQVPLKSLEVLLGRSVFVNYPQVHEAKIVAITSETEEIVLVEERAKPSHAAHSNHPANAHPTTSIRHIQYDADQAKAWRMNADSEEKKYFQGRGLPGTGGLQIGVIRFMVRVKLLQGLARDSSTGAAKKVFSSSSTTDLPIQLILLQLPAPDPRFEEVSELPVERLFPVGTSVVAVAGQLIGCVGKVVGPHKAHEKGKKPQPHAATSRRKIVDVEFQLPQPEQPFGYSIAKAMREIYFSSRDTCNKLKISSSLLGKVSGSIRVDSHRVDIGLNLKRKGMYQLLGYVRKVDISQQNNRNNGNNSNNQQRDAFGKVGRQVWQSHDTVKLIGIEENKNDSNGAEDAEAVYWEYSQAAIDLINEYKSNFPELFESLERLPGNTFAYQAKELFPSLASKNNDPGASANAGPVKTVDSVMASIVDWMKAHPSFHLPRTAFTTTSLSQPAMTAIERAADEQTSLNQHKGFTTFLVKGIAIEKIYSNLHRSSQDVALTYNTLEPRLGDRIVNLTCTGVPFGLRGTVVTIHHATKFVEVIFDEEFIGGKSLHGNCSQFRGHLCAWSDLLLVSGGSHHSQSNQSHNNSSFAHAANVKRVVPPHAYTAKELGVTSVDVVSHTNDNSKKPAQKSPKHTDNKDHTEHTKQSEVLPEAKAKKVGQKVEVVVATTYADDESVASIDILLDDKPLEALVKKSETTQNAEKGSGWSSLIAAAGINMSLEESLQALKIQEDKSASSTHFVPPMPALIPSNSASTATSSKSGVPTSGHNDKGKQLLSHLSGNTSKATHSNHPEGPKVTIDKKAANRIVKHELGRQQTQPPSNHKDNKPFNKHPSTVQPSSSTTAPNQTAITSLLQNAKKIPAAENKQSGNLNAHAKDFKPTILKRDQHHANTTHPPVPSATESKAVDSNKTAALTNLLNRNKPAVMKTPEKKGESHVDDFDNIPPPPPPTPAETATATTAAEENSQKTQPKKVNLNKLLSNARQHYKKDTTEAKDNAPAVTTSVPSDAAAPAPAVKKVTHLLFPKKEESEAEK